MLVLIGCYLRGKDSDSKLNRTLRNFSKTQAASETGQVMNVVPTDWEQQTTFIT